VLSYSEWSSDSMWNSPAAISLHGSNSCNRWCGNLRPGNDDIKYLMQMTYSEFAFLVTVCDWSCMGSLYCSTSQYITPIYKVSQDECARLQENVPYVKVHRYNPKHLYPKLNGYGDNGQRSLKVWQLLHTYWLPNSY